MAAIAQASDSLWTLQQSIQYAVDHNLDIRQSELNERLARLLQLQSQLSRIPSASVSTNLGRSYGRSIDPTSNQFINQGYTFAGLGGNVDVLLFGWFQKRNAASQYRLLAESAEEDAGQLRDNISLNVATAFLRILLARERIGIAENQLALSQEQQTQVALFVRTGRSPELDLMQVEAQVATDSSLVIDALNEYQLAILDIKAILNFDISAPFEPEAPLFDMDASYLEISRMPDEIYEIAGKRMGVIRSNRLQLSAAEKELAVAKATLYPQLTLGAQFGTNYSSSLKEISDVEITGYKITGNVVSYNNELLPVMEPDYHLNMKTTDWTKQFSNNFRQTVALNLVVPLFSGWNARTNVGRAKINIQSKRYALEQAQVKLKQDVYKAFYDVRSAMQKYQATTRAKDASEKAWLYAEKRYELGLMSALELMTTKNNFFKASSDALSAKYDLVFKLKVIDYYLGKEIRL